MQAVVNVIPKVQPQQVKAERHRRVGLYGGTFNPVHNAHLLVAEQVGRTLSLDKVSFLPDMQPPHRDHKGTIAADLRVDMLKLAVADNPFFDIEMEEINRGGVSYTYDTIKALKERHPDTYYYFIIGGDMVDYLPTWNKIDQLVEMVNFVGVRRKGAKNEAQYPVIWVDVPTVAISSSDIRARVKSGQSIRYMVPRAVEDYIKEHQLYID
ncbi:nicotinate-nucleotide adenylyltransferase [Limosilactobacillus fermentum]|uniref:nicotinate-nucleotide adenylyltransferase n=1 Tax=Limosilactobacillus fermentum TaxID=1613 RepID=UPI0021820C31|nr:nicotinate-nucleotide adenylyltransferase [Limosilactobacillus fermentum]MCS8609851.1 nicotinate-nucleotide adenylyltransferase [Limosilactobacillus fermentum]MCT3465068.1 nicotinate-nucleotide adenylyltransferase [Limosilactobacillus fermentum]